MPTKHVKDGNFDTVTNRGTQVNSNSETVTGNAPGGAKVPISLGVPVTYITLDDTIADLTLDKGTVGQVKTVILTSLTSSGSDVAILDNTDGNLIGSTAFTLGTAGDSMTFIYTADGWAPLSIYVD